jgi:hypothetical protein
MPIIFVAGCSRSCLDVHEGTHFASGCGCSCDGFNACRAWHSHSCGNACSADWADWANWDCAGVCSRRGDWWNQMKSDEIRWNCWYFEHFWTTSYNFIQHRTTLYNTASHLQNISNAEISWNIYNNLQMPWGFLRSSSLQYRGALLFLAPGLLRISDTIKNAIIPLVLWTL